MELKDSTLEFKSKYEPIPLSEVEEALLVWSGTGLTGLCLADLPPENGIDLLCQWTGVHGRQPATTTVLNFSLQTTRDFIILM